MCVKLLLFSMKGKIKQLHMECKLLTAKERKRNANNEKFP